MMQISALHVLTPTARQKAPRFQGILADVNAPGEQDYARRYNGYLKDQPNELFPWKTQLFRLPHVPLALAECLGSQPVELHVLGGSDGSSAVSHGLALLQKRGPTGTATVKIHHVEQHPDLVALAQKGVLRASPREVAWASQHAPIASNHLTPATEEQAQAADAACSTPLLQSVRAHEPDAQWYPWGPTLTGMIQTHGRDLVAHLQQPRDRDKVHVYDLSNTVMYYLSKPQATRVDPAEWNQSVKTVRGIFQKIAAKNTQKGVYVILGENELRLENTRQALFALLTEQKFQPLMIFNRQLAQRYPQAQMLIFHLKRSA